jgi:hypothetical protein
MKNRLTKILAALVVLASSANVSSASVVTFEDQPSGTPTTFTSGGLTFTSPSGIGYVWAAGSGKADNGTNNLIIGYNSTITITKTGGGTFTLTQLDAGLSWYTGEDSYNLTVNGTDVITLGNTFKTYSFEDLTNVTSVILTSTLNDGYLGVDNIVYEDDQVPEPANLLLLGIGTIGLVVTHRRKLV